MAHYSRPPVALTFLAPAERCNQRCPACILDLTNEPVRSFTLLPEDYALVVEQFVDAGVPLLFLSFQGYEVTLARSWPYVEAVFEVAKAYGIHRSFITNGMLLHKWASRVRVLGPDRISVSLDGSEAETNDPIRGLDGAFTATTRSLERFLDAAPEYRERMAVASTLSLARNYRSLRGMPRLLRELGVPRWVLSVEVNVREGRWRPVQPSNELSAALGLLVMEGEDVGLKVHVNDEFGIFRGTERLPGFQTLYRPEFLVRVEPAGFVRVGHEVAEAFDARTARRFDPKVQSIVDVMGYRDSERTYRAEMRRHTRVSDVR